MFALMVLCFQGRRISGNIWLRNGIHGAKTSAGFTEADTFSVKYFGEFDLICKCC